MSRLLELTGWLVVSATVTAGLYWLFLNTPESSVPMLAASAALLLALVVWVAIAGSALVLRAVGTPRRVSISSAWRQTPWFITIAAVAAVASWAILAIDGRIGEASGDISAWFIATFNWTDATPFFRAASWISVWIRWAVIPLAALAALTHVLRGGAPALVSSRWVRSACHWRTLLVATLASGALMVLPWRYTSTWQPFTSLPLWLEVPVATARLGTVVVAMALGAAIILVVAAGRTTDTNRP